ncbi:DUF6221 family protein [Nocardia sp. NPDC058519]|uniref:DUF6221 family protein n=1 Tax=Nocardia sp. NPDC058519 TaxID=3346535 RepID=UPI00365766FC
MTIEEFIEARLDEDEALAKRQEPTWYLVEDDLGREAGTDLMEYFQRHDPARVLRQVAALRATLQHAVAAGEFDDGYHYEQGDGSTSEVRVDTLIHRALAGIWADHPDFRPEWGA